ncbi:hypothetical protein QOZ80_4BG0332740 [Eleusine coracana subsp. coracana]|nr:hypothetical protein QOZ80_4BG0332740 [Eleusine coracana subsp. coracana]
MRDLFGIKLMRRTCDGDSGKEFPVDFMYFLKCYISEGVNHLTHGLEVCSKSYEKFSPNRGVPCNESTIIEISRYLTVQFLRLNWNIDSKESGKILQRVEYPATFDIKDYCSDGLKEKLEATREVFWGSSSEGIDKVSSSTETQQLTGIYDLICVLTHEGTSTDSGHYVAWIKQEGQWIMCDGDQVYVCEEQEVVGLSGGNEGHAAYICLYKGQTLRVQAEDEAMTDH